MNIGKELTYLSFSASPGNRALNGAGKQMWLLNVISSLKAEEKENILQCNRSDALSSSCGGLC